MTDQELLISVGGQRHYEGGLEAWSFGWIPPEYLDGTAQTLYRDQLRQLAPFPDHLRAGAYDTDRSLLYLWLADPKVKAATREALYPGLKQYSGSCVGVSGGNLTVVSSAYELGALGETADPKGIIPFWPFGYGRSRYHSGIRGRGEGSTGLGMALALTRDGNLYAGPDLPPLTDRDMYEVGRAVEIAWSNGAERTDAQLSAAKPNNLRQAARVKDADECRAALVAGCVILWCGSWGGLMRCEIRGEPPVLMSRHVTTWYHCQTCCAWWDHPSLGELYYIWNTWGKSAHGVCPSGAPAGGYWIRKADCDWQCQHGECIAISGVNGFTVPGPVPPPPPPPCHG